MKSAYRLLLLILTINFSLYASGTQPSGSGISGDPYQVSTLDHLLWISTNSGSWGAYFEQTADISGSSTSSWNGGNGFSPIGNSSTKFTGSYDGQGFGISNLWISRTSTDYVGFFGYLSGATIQNLGLNYANIYGHDYVGILAGRDENSNITACWTSEWVDGNEYVGGLIGATNASSTVTGCYLDYGYVMGVNYVGGLVGRNEGVVVNCYTNVTSMNVLTYSEYVGGLVGINSGTISCSKAHSVFSFENPTQSECRYFGGFVGRNDGTINDCCASGDVKFPSMDTDPWFAEYHGAFAGRSTATITNSYTTASVTCASGPSPTTKGFVGFGSGTTANNFFDSDRSNQSTASGATAKTTLEMKTLATFTNETTTGLTTAWDFESNPNDDDANNDYWDMDLTGSTNSGRPFLSWENGTDTSLPVELSYFAGVQKDLAVQLSWATESETENLGFIIERHQDQKGWIEIASFRTHPELEGQGSTSQHTEYTFLDKHIEGGEIFEYRLADVSYDSFKQYHDMPAVEIEIEIFLPAEFSLMQNFPNPFNPITTIEYRLPEDSFVSLVIYDVRGQIIQTLESSHQNAGWHEFNWNGQTNDGKIISTGLYFARIVAGDYSNTIKMLYLK